MTSSPSGCRVRSARASHWHVAPSTAAPTGCGSISCRQRAGAASDKLLSTVRLLAQLHPNRPLERGYARITSRDNEHVGRTADARRIGALTLHFADGAINGPG